MENDISKILITKEEIQQKINEFGYKINNDYKEKDLIMISLLKGSIIFMSDLMRAININCKIDFMSVSSYGLGHKTSGTVKIIKDLDIDIINKDVLIIEDILDSGLTLEYIISILSKRKPKSIKICTLLNKPEKRQVDIIPDYSGFDVPNKFIVGYGLDYAEKYRNLPYIAVLKPEIYIA